MTHTEAFDKYYREYDGWFIDNRAIYEDELAVLLILYYWSHRYVFLMTFKKPWMKRTGLLKITELLSSGLLTRKVFSVRSIP